MKTIDFDNLPTDTEQAAQSLLGSITPDDSEVVSVWTASAGPPAYKDLLTWKEVRNLREAKLARLNRSTIWQHGVMVCLLNACTAFMAMRMLSAMAEEDFLPAIVQGAHVTTELEQEDGPDIVPEHRDTYPPAVLEFVDVLGGLHRSRSAEEEDNCPRIASLTRVALADSMRLHRLLWRIADVRNERDPGREAKPPRRLARFRTEVITKKRVEHVMHPTYVNAFAGWSAIVAASYGIEEALGPGASSRDVTKNMLSNMDVLGRLVGSSILKESLVRVPSDTFQDVISHCSGERMMRLDNDGRLHIPGLATSAPGRCPIKGVYRTPELSGRAEPLYKTVEAAYEVTIPRPQTPYVHPGNLYLTMATLLGANYGLNGNAHKMVNYQANTPSVAAISRS